MTVGAVSNTAALNVELTSLPIDEAKLNSQLGQSERKQHSGFISAFSIFGQTNEDLTLQLEHIQPKETILPLTPLPLGTS